MQINSSGISSLANTSFSTALVEGRIGTDFVDWQAGGSVLLKNRVSLSGSGIRSNANTNYITDEWATLDTVVSYAASGSFTVPTGVTRVWALLVAGGGGGSGGYSYSVTTGSGDTATTTTYQVGGRSGGDGGAGFKALSVSPGNTISFTIGAAGAGGANGGNGAIGGDSSLTFGAFTMSCTGGGRGTVGTTGSTGSPGAATGADYNMGGTYTPLMATLQGAIDPDIYAFQVAFTNPHYDYIRTQLTARGGATTAVAYSYAGSYKMGANGTGGAVYGNAGSGGVGGGVFFFYKAP